MPTALETSSSVAAPTSNSSDVSGMGRSFSIGTWLGIPIQVNFTYFILLIFAVLESIRYKLFKYSLYIFILYGPILFFTILIHEFGHALTARKLGGVVHGIIMWPLGGLAICGQPDPPSPKANILVAIAGPMTHIAQMIVWGVDAFLFTSASTSNSFKLDYYFLLYGNAADFMVNLCLAAFYMNLALMLFNLFIPAYPLDGGQIFASALTMCGCLPQKAGMATSITGIIIGFVLIIYGIVSVFAKENPFSIMNILVGAFICSSSFGLYKLVKAGKVQDHPLFQSTATDNTRSGIPVARPVEAVEDN